MDEADTIPMQRHESQSVTDKLIPWVASAGLAVSHLVIASQCTVPSEGRCATCGGCVVVLGGIVSWALYKKKDRNVFYEEHRMSP